MTPVSSPNAKIRYSTPADEKKKNNKRSNTDAEIARLSELLKEKDHLIKEKDHLINELSLSLETKNIALETSLRTENQTQGDLPGVLGLAKLREEHHEVIQKFQNLNKEINTLRNECKNFQQSKSIGIDTTLNLSQLNKFDSTYNKLEAEFYNLRDPIKQVIESFSSFLKKVQYPSFSQEQKVGFCAITLYSLDNFDKAKTAFENERNQCVSILCNLQVVYSNTVERFTNTTAHLNSIDNSIHYSSNRIKFYVGQAGLKTRTFYPDKVIANAAVTPENSAALDEASATIPASIEGLKQQ